MNAPLTYLKKRLRWAHAAEEWPFYKRVVGCGVDCDCDGEGYLLNSDGSRTSTSDENAARILLFSRMLAASNAAAMTSRFRIWLARKILAGLI